MFDKAFKEYKVIMIRFPEVNRKKLFDVVIVQIGNRDDTGVGSSSAGVATWVLKDYVKKFQLRNL